MWMKYEGLSKIMASDFLVSETHWQEWGRLPALLSPPNSMLKICQQKSSCNFIFLPQTMSWPLGTTAQNMSAYGFAQNCSPFSTPSTEQIYIWCTQPCPVSAFSCLPLQCSQRRLCGHRGGSGDHICASCSKESVPKTQSRRHLNSPEMQEVR